MKVSEFFILYSYSKDGNWGAEYIQQNLNIYDKTVFVTDKRTLKIEKLPFLNNINKLINYLFISHLFKLQLANWGENMFFFVKIIILKLQRMARN